MKTLHSLSLFAFTAEALIARDVCCFQLSGPSGPVGQLPDGQLRLNQSLPAVQFCINRPGNGENGDITDSQGRLCRPTGPTGQVQCDKDAPSYGQFSIHCEGENAGKLMQENYQYFWACPTGDNGGYNIYSKPLSGQNQCIVMTLATTNDMCGHCNALTPTPQTTGGCGNPLTLTDGKFEFPHLILPIDSKAPTIPVKTSYNGIISLTQNTLFTFDIPANGAGQTCNLIFLLPNKSDLHTSDYTLTSATNSGSATFTFASLVAAPEQGMTWNTAPAVKDSLNMIEVQPGGGYVVSTWSCPAGQRVGFEMWSCDGSGLEWFQDSNPAAIGLYITKC